MDDAFLKAMGARLRDARKTNGFTQKAVSEFIGIKRSSLSDYENGKRCIGVGTLDKLTEIYGFSMDYFVKGPADEIKAGSRTTLPTCKLSTYQDQKALMWARRLLHSFKAMLQSVKEGSDGRQG